MAREAAGRVRSSGMQSGGMRKRLSAAGAARVGEHLRPWVRCGCARAPSPRRHGRWSDQARWLGCSGRGSTQRGRWWRAQE
eukprot:184727-Prymnesium_polylepis.1